MTLRQDLEAAKALIDTPEKWAKGADLISPDRPKHCAYTACFDVARGRRYYDMTDALDNEAPGDPTGRDLPAVAFNDLPTTTHADIMALFDRAINAAPVDFTGLDTALDELRKPVDEMRE